MPWTYRIMKSKHVWPDGEEEWTFGIHEIFYEEGFENEPWGWTTEPVALTGSSHEGLRTEIERAVRDAFSKKVLNYDRKPGPGGPDPTEKGIVNLDELVKEQELDDAAEAIE